MRRSVPASFLVALACATRVPGDDPKRLADLTRIRQAMTAELLQLPNYTCAETIERFGADARHKLRTLDTLHFSVAVVNGRELYAWPGGAFQDKGITHMVSSGFISDGNFSVMPRKAFSVDALTWFVGDEKLGGRNAVRYDFQIPAARAGWNVSAGAAYARAGVKGSFWADASTLEVLKLEFAADGLPAWLQNKSLEQSIEYTRVSIGQREALLPRRTEMETESFSGERHENHAVFTDCHEYGSQSTIRFDVDQDLIPANVSLKLRLETEIDSASAAIGDPLKATLLEPVSFEGGSLSAGAAVTGAIVSLRRDLGTDPHCELGIQWSLVEDEGKTWNLQGKLGDVGSFPDLRHNLLESLYRADGLGSIVTVNGVLGRIPTGVQMTFRTTGRR